MSRESLKKTCDEAPEYHQIQGHFGIPLRPSSKGRVPALLLEINIDPQFRRVNHPKGVHFLTISLWTFSLVAQRNKWYTSKALAMIWRYVSLMNLSLDWQPICQVVRNGKLWTRQEMATRMQIATKHMRDQETTQTATWKPWGLNIFIVLIIIVVYAMCGFHRPRLML